MFANSRVSRETRSPRARAHAGACRASARTLRFRAVRVTRRYPLGAHGLFPPSTQQESSVCAASCDRLRLPPASLSSRSMRDHASIDDDATCAILRSPPFGVRSIDRRVIIVAAHNTRSGYTIVRNITYIIPNADEGARASKSAARYERSRIAP